MRSIMIALLATLISVAPATAEQVWVTMDQVRTYTMSEDADSIIIGNPGIADIAVRDKNSFLLFGKAPGMTNLIVLDGQGNQVKNLEVRVNPPSYGMLVYHRGLRRTTYNCTNDCQPTLTVGDSPDDFTRVNQQVRIKTSQREGGSTPADLQNLQNTPENPTPGDDEDSL